MLICCESDKLINLSTDNNKSYTYQLINDKDNMIRLNCFFQANDGEQYKTALQAAIALTEHSQKHEGCIAYDVFQSATRPDVFMICETWEDPASLDKHSATSEFKKYSPMMRQCGQMKVEKFNNA